MNKTELQILEERLSEVNAEIGQFVTQPIFAEYQDLLQERTNLEYRIREIKHPFPPSLRRIFYGMLFLLLVSPVFGKVERKLKPAERRQENITYQPAGVCGGFIVFRTYKCFNPKKGFWHSDNDKCLDVLDVFDPPCVKEVK